MPRVVRRQERHVERPHRLRRAGDREAERVRRVDEHPREVVGVDLPAVVVEVLADLLEHDPLLDVDVEEARPNQHVGEELARRGERLGRQGQREDAVVDLSCSIQVSAVLLEREVHVVRGRQPVGAAVHHVLEEMADPARLLLLEARPHAHVQGDVRAMELRLRSGDDPKSVVERRDLRPRARHYGSSSSKSVGAPPSLPPCSFV